MAAVYKIIYSDFGTQKNKVWHCFHCFPIYFPWSDIESNILTVPDGMEAKERLTCKGPPERLPDGPAVKDHLGDFLMVQQLRLHASMAGSMSLILGWGTKSHMLQSGA